MFIAHRSDTCNPDKINPTVTVLEGKQYSVVLIQFLLLDMSARQFILGAERSLVVVLRRETLLNGLLKQKNNNSHE